MQNHRNRKQLKNYRQMKLTTTIGINHYKKTYEEGKLNEHVFKNK